MRATQSCRLLLLAALIVLAPGLSAAATLINYQGQLAPAAGSTVPNGTFTITFSIWSDSVGGSQLWGETKSLAVNNGLFSTMLGSHVPIGLDVMGPEGAHTNGLQRFLQVQISGDTPMLPRLRVGTSPFAAAAQRIRGDISTSPGEVMVGTCSMKGNATSGGILFSDTTGETLAVVQCSLGDGLGNAGWETSLQLRDPETLSRMVAKSTQVLFSAPNLGQFSTLSTTSLMMNEDEIGSSMLDGARALVFRSGVGDTLCAFSRYGIRFADGTWQYSAQGGDFLPRSGGVMEGPITSSDAPSISMGKANFGVNNSNNGSNAFVTGLSNSASANYSTVSGGTEDTASGEGAAVAGGQRNIASGPYSMVAGGSNNTASGWRSFAGGFAAKATHNNSFVWADGTPADFNSDRSDQAKFRVNGGMKINVNGGHWIEIYNFILPSSRLISTSTGAYLSSGGTWTNSSDANLKENFSEVSGEEILQKISDLPISEWNYRSEEDAVRHIGPTAQDFHAAFGLGNDTTSISTIDPSGVALAAIKELIKQNKELKAEISSLKEQLVNGNRDTR